MISPASAAVPGTALGGPLKLAVAVSPRLLRKVSCTARWQAGAAAARPDALAAAAGSDAGAANADPVTAKSASANCVRDMPASVGRAGR